VSQLVPIKMVWWDVDGVLILSRGFSGHLDRAGIRPADVAPFFSGPFQDCLVGRADLRTVLPPYLRQWGWKGSVDEFLGWWFESERVFNPAVHPYLEKLAARGLTQYLATNQEHQRLLYLWNELELNRLLNGSLASAELGARKPDPAYFAAALDKLGNPDPATVLFWDDTASNVEAARRAGITAHQYVDADSFAIRMAKYGL